MKSARIIVIGLSAFLIAGSLLAQENRGYVAAASDGNGDVKLFWPIPRASWPSQGYTLERVDTSGKAEAIASGLRPNWNDGLTKALPQSQSDPLIKLDAMDRQAASGRPPEDYNGLKGFMFINAATDFNFAKACGLAWEDNPQGPVVYRLKDGAGNVLGISLAVDPREITPPAAAPQAVKAEVTAQGVDLDWEAGPPTPGMPEFFFRVKRDDGGGMKVLGKGPIFPGNEEERKKQKLPRFTDDTAPPEQDVTYTVVALDVFGRESSPSQPLKIFVPDVAASFPPAAVTADSKPGAVEVAWSKPQSPRTSGYMVERSAFSQGPYTMLTQKPIPAGTLSYSDSSGTPGTHYYYRVYSLDPRQKPGAPSHATAAVFLGLSAPASPEGLEASKGADAISLKWNAVKGAAGYRVEKTAGEGDRWAYAGNAIVMDTRFDDPIVLGMEGVMRYRVTAVSGDNQASAPSAELKVELPPNRAPATPKITGFDGMNGAAHIQFIPGGDPEQAQGFLVLRSATRAGEPRVLNSKPLDGTARDFTDDKVVPGQEYWYSLVAVDSAQNRSEASAPLAVRIGDPVLKAPEAPKLQYLESPFPRVVISFDPGPGVTAAVVERQLAGSTEWSRVAGPLAPGTAQALDTRPPKGQSVSYRLYYQALSGATGPLSQAATLKVP